MSTPRKDFIFEKKAKVYKEIQLKNNDGTNKSLVGYVVKCIIKESYATDTILFELTEANGGVIVLDDPNASFALAIDADDMDIIAERAVYEVLQIDSNFEDTEITKILKGKITFVEGL